MLYLKMKAFKITIHSRHLPSGEIMFVISRSPNNKMAALVFDTILENIVYASILVMLYFKMK